jgi:putative transcriptional regulator
MLSRAEITRMRAAAARTRRRLEPDGATPSPTSRRAGLAAAVAAVLVALAAAGVTPVGSSEPRAAVSLTGQLLVATPEMQDPRFARTVLYMVHHDASGAEGLVLNRPLGEVSLAALLHQMRMESAGATGSVRLHSGGPVDPPRMLVLHTAEYAAEGTRVIKDGIALTQQSAILGDIARGKGPRRAFLALGYAGWAPGQLEAEMKAGAWVRAPADEALVFDTDYERKWDRATERRRIDL